MTSLNEHVRWNSVGRLAATLALAAGLAGCGASSPIDSMTFYPVKGKVLLNDGKPLTSGKVVFAATKSSLTSLADIGSDGTFEFKGSKAGLPEGEYKVRIETEGSGVKGAGARKGSVLFSSKYLDEDASGLTAVVKPVDDNSFEFKLTNDSLSPAGGQRRGGRG